MHNVFSKSDPLTVDCESNYSFFFDFIEKEVAGHQKKPFHRICTVMRKMKAKCFVREELEADVEIAEELAAISLRAGKTVNGVAVRFTFFRKAPTDGSWKQLENKDILGYAVLLKIDPPLEIHGIQRRTIHGYILEAVIAPPSIHLDGGLVEGVTNYYVHSCKSFATTIGKPGDSKAFSFVGTFFCQQNGFTNACAHAALRMAINSWPRYAGPKLTSEGVNKILKVDHGACKDQPNRGLNSREMTQVIVALGHEADVGDFRSSPDINYEEYIYPLIESGCPVILGLSKSSLGTAQSPAFSHVVAVMGHTLNSDRWGEARHGYGAIPTSHYISASAWADHFIVNDDNFGMHVTLPTEAVKNIIVPKYNPNLFASIGIGILPTKPLSGDAEKRIKGYAAEQTASILLPKLLHDKAVTAPNRWFKLLKDGNHAPVLRTFFRTRAEYVVSLSRMRDDQGKTLHASEVQFVERLLPDSLWITEVMTAALYTGNKRKLGEIVLKTAASEKDIRSGKAALFAWLPGVRWHGSLLNEGPKEWAILGHVPLTRGIPADACKLEW